MSQSALSLNVVTPLYPQKGKSLHALCITAIVLSTIAVILRFWSRVTLPRGAKFGIDDWCALGAWVFIVAQISVTMAGTRAGLGLHIIEVPYGNVVRLLQYFFAGFVTYNVGISLVRCSAVFFYHRVFHKTSKVLHYLIWGTIAFNIAWMVGLTLTSIFSCIPVQAFWNRTIENASCSKVTDQQWASGVTSVVLDLWILMLPLPFLWKLQIGLKKKLMVLGVFVVGYCVVVFTIGRLVSVLVAGSALDSDITCE